MKYLTSICCFLLLTGCNAKKATLITKNQKFEAKTNCPEDGVCSVELIPNSKLDIKKGSLGELYSKIEDGENLVFKFTYTRNKIEGVQDGHYIEEVYAELDPNLTDINIKDNELQNVKFLYNRSCYCKGQAGFYKIENGNFFVKKTDSKTYNIQFQSTILEVPQIVTKINETLILD